MISLSIAEVDPSKRLTSAEACEMEVFQAGESAGKPFGGRVSEAWGEPSFSLIRCVCGSSCLESGV